MACPDFIWKDIRSPIDHQIETFLVILSKDEEVL